MLDSFKNLLKKPEFPNSPDEIDFLEKQQQNENEPFLVDNREDDEKEDKEENGQDEKTEPEEVSSSKVSAPPRQEKKNGAWLRTAIGMAAIVGVACIGYFWAASSDAPVPADIPQGDILASLAAEPTAAPPSKENVAASASEASPQKIASNAVPNSSPPPAANPKPSVPAASVIPSPQANPTETTQKKPAFSAFGSNPFIDLSVLHTEAAASTGLGLPAINGSGNRALPEVPRPIVSPDLLPSPGEIRTPAAPVGSPSAPPAMGGLITKPNGESIAIMGDGTVLSEGDTYKGDRRVTFIGGDGITFDDGNTVPFGQNK